MSNYRKHSYILLFLGVFLCLGRPAHAQVYYREVTFKDSLVQLLFQYGREVYYRGVDPQEAAYVFQRILVLDCRHDGAQDFLSKIHNKYPNISIRIHGCAEDTNETLRTLDLEVPTSKQDKRSLRAERTSKSLTPDIGLEPSFETKIVDETLANRATPLQAFSEPLSLSSSPALETSQNIDHFPIIEPPASADLQAAAVSEMTGINKDCEQLRSQNKNLENEIAELKLQIQAKDEAIFSYQKQLSSIKGQEETSYTSIVQDQKDLIRIQQDNIDYLGKELDGSKIQASLDPVYKDMRQQIASAQLNAKESEMDLEAKSREAQLLQKQLAELREQLRLVKRILSEKNDIIKSLQDELDSVKTEK